MPKHYRSGFEKLSRLYSDTDERYMNALLTLKENFSGFTKKAGYDPSHPEKLTPARKKQIRRYFNTYTDLTEGRQSYKMKPSELPVEIKQSKNGIEATKRAAQMRTGRKRSKYIFIKYDGENIPTVKIRNGAPVFVNEKLGIAREIIELNKVALAQDPIGTIMSIESLTYGAKFYRILSAEHEFYNAGTLSQLAKKVVELQNKYQIGNHAWQNWLDGVIAYYSDTLNARQIINHENKAKQDFRKRVKRENAKARSKRK
jgi:hypothetical protein